MIDLHLHLDGAITVPIAKKLAKLQNITLPAENDEELEDLLSVPASCESLNDFLKCFALPCMLLQTPEGLSEAVRLVCDELKNLGLFYAEIKFAPQLHTEKEMTQEDAVKAALKGLKETSFKCNLILCCMRGEGNESKNLETLRIAEKYLVQDGGVVAVDLAGAEALYPNTMYGELFEKVNEMSLPFTLHAGEASGPDSVRAAIDFGAVRLGHGVRACEDPELVDLIRDRGIFVEMCPTSNRQTKAVADMKDYPFMDFLEKGIKVTLNTDDPAIERTNLFLEYEYMEKEFGLTSSQRRILLNNSIDAAFTTDAVKEELRKMI